MLQDNAQAPAAAERYRPTVRYDPVYRQYVEQLFHATHLDRQEIIILALFAAPFSAIFRSKIEVHLKPGKEYPLPIWQPQDKHLWKAGGQNARE